MQAERDHLVRFVFPQLREELIKYRIHLVDVDLRWGVTSDQDAYEVCMEEIDNCHPRFICMLGGRYGWIPPKSNISITASEIHYGALDKLDIPTFRYFYFRDPEVTNSIPEEFAEDYREPKDSESEKLLETLKVMIIDPETKGKVLVKPDKVECESLRYYEYPCRWDNTLNRIVDLQSFGNRVYSDLMDSIESEFGKTKIGPLNEFEEEKAAMESFIEDKIENYVIGSRKKILEYLYKFADGKTENNYSLLLGDPGSGKTALLAKFYQKYVGFDKNFDKLIIPHFIGVTSKSTDMRLILRRFCYELSKSINSDEEIPEDYYKLILMFNSLLDKISNVKSVLILIDAINQLGLSEDTFDLGWLPQKLPENVHIVISTLPGTILESFENSQIQYEEIKLPKLQPADSENIIENFLQRYRKTFDSEQKSALMEKKDSDNPLYLLTALEELRTLGTYEEITQRIRYLPERVCPLFQWILKRLENDQGFRNNHGEIIGDKLVTEFVSLIGVSRQGLSQTELTELIYPGDPQGNIAALQRLLRPHLMYKGELIDFYHGQLLEAVENKYLNNKSNKLTFHKKLAEYFLNKADPENNYSWKGKNTHALSELPYHQTSGEMWDEIEKTLCDLRFIETKCAMSMTYELIKDYNLALEMHPDAQEENKKKLEHEKRVDKYVKDLIAYSKGEIKHLDIISSVRPWTEEEIRKDNERMINNPEPLECIKSFLQFLNSQSQGLVEFGSMSGYCLQQAYNYADSSPVTVVAKKIAKYFHEPLILRDEKWLPEYYPHTALLKTLNGHKDFVFAVDITPDGKTAISGGQDKTARVWDLKTGEQLQKLEGHTKSIIAVAVTPDGKTAITAGGDFTVRIWNLKTGEQIKFLQGHQDNIFAVDITPDGKKAITGSQDKKAILWDLKTGKPIKTLEEHTESKTSVTITPDGKTAIIGDASDEYPEVFVWDLKNRGKIKKLPLAHINFISAVDVTPDGKTAITAGGDFTVRIWNLKTGEQIKFLQGHQDNIFAVDITPDGKKAITGSQDKKAILWDLKTGKPIKTLKGHTHVVSSVAITPDGKKAITGSWDYTLKVWDLEKGSQNEKIHTDYVYAVDITPDGKTAITASGDNTVRIWNLKTGKQIQSLKDIYDNLLQSNENLFWIFKVAISPDGETVITGDILGRVRIWNLKTGKEIKTLWGHKYGFVFAVAVTPDGKKVISGGKDKTAIVWDLKTGQQIQKLEGHTESIMDVAVTPDGKKVITGSNDNSVKVWDLETGKQIQTLNGHTDYVWTVSITPDGKKLITGSWDNCVKVWDLETGKQTQTLKGHTDVIKKVAVTPDGKKVITGSQDSFVRIYDLETGKLISVSKEESDINSLTLKAGVFASVTGVGDVIFAHLFNIFDLTFITANRIWSYGQNGTVGCWDENITADCQWCGNRFKVDDEILNTIKEIEKQYKKPNGWIDDEAWEDPRLISECPECHKKLKFNPFIVDNSNG